MSRESRPEWAPEHLLPVGPGFTEPEQLGLWVAPLAGRVRRGGPVPRPQAALWATIDLSFLLMALRAGTVGALPVQSAGPRPSRFRQTYSDKV
jgi:hypothetical protein